MTYRGPCAHTSSVTDIPLSTLLQFKSVSILQIIFTDLLFIYLILLRVNREKYVMNVVIKEKSSGFAYKGNV